MTDDRKPRNFEIFYSGLAGTFSVRNNLDVHIMSEREDLSDEYIRLIELEPTLQLIEEMSEALRFYLEIKPITDDGAHAFLALEEYRKFKEGLR